MNPTLKALAQQDMELMTSVNEVQLVTCSYDPVTWQAILRRRDRTMVQGVGVGSTPQEALDLAYENLLTQKPGPQFYYSKRNLAEDYRLGLSDLFSDEIAWSKTELVPYRGWVVVVSPTAGFEAVIRKALSTRAEIRTGDRPTRSTKKPATGQKSGVSGDPAPTPPADGKAPGKKYYMDLYKQKHGKFPDQNIKKADLIEMMRQEGLVE